MVQQAFIALAKLSAAASVLGLVLLLLRALLKGRLPRWVFYAAWGLVLVRLLLPFSLPSSFSVYNLVPSLPIAAGQVTVPFPTLQPTPSVPEATANTASSQTDTPETVYTVAPAAVPLVVLLSTVWLCGLVTLVGYSLLCYGYTRWRIGRGEPLEQLPLGRRTIPVVRCGLFAGPVVCGLVRPVIALPHTLDESVRTQVLAHELTHVRRWDNLWQGLFTLAVYLHWMNPFCWLFHRYFLEDMEVSCDQWVCREGNARSYAAALVELAEQNRNQLAGGFLAFGESFLTQRVRAVLRRSTTSLRLVLLAGAVGVGLVLVFLTNPVPSVASPSAPAIAVSPVTPATSQAITPPAQSAESSLSAPSQSSSLPFQQSSSDSTSSPAPPTQPAMTYREDNPPCLQIDLAKIETATLIDKDMRVALRIPKREVTEIVTALNAILPQQVDNPRYDTDRLRMLQLRMTDGSKYEYYLYSDALVCGDQVFRAEDTVWELYWLLPKSGSFGAMDWGPAMAEWLGYMNPLRIHQVTLTAGEGRWERTTQTSQAAREDILWLAEQLCGLSFGSGWQSDKAMAIEDHPAVTIEMDFLDSSDRYTLTLFETTHLLRIETVSIDYALHYQLEEQQYERLLINLKNRGLLPS